MTLRIADIFSRTVQRNDCWEWQGPRTTKGYGKMKIGRRTVLVHRHVCALMSGREWDPSLMVRHACDNPPCVNPAHLITGTARDNYRDSVERGRRPPPVTQCPHGHVYDAENTRIDTRGRRRCRQCERLRSRARHATHYHHRLAPFDGDSPGTQVPPRIPS